MEKNQNVLKWVEEIKALTNPDEVVWITGSAEEIEYLKEKACECGELIKLNEETCPNCYLHRSDIGDVARVESRTFICTKNKDEAGPTNNWMDKDEAYAMLTNILKDSMKGRTMYVIPYLMGPEGSPFSKVGYEITDSAYVVLNMNIMTRMGSIAEKQLGMESNDFVRGVHSTVLLDPENRYICHFPEDKTIWSVNSGYGGNALLGKKCFALRIASTQGQKEGWLAEHMLIMGIEDPEGNREYIAAAFPSACGKTNLAMLIPPELYTKKGYKYFTVGDDIAWLRISEQDGRLYAVNPEAGFFGVVPGTNEKSNPNALKTIAKDTIFTNVVHNLDDNSVWWEGLENPPTNALDWKGEKWDAKSGTKGAHPNSRFTASALNCPSIAAEFNKPEGVPISAIVFGGRRAKTAPLAYEARNWQHGVFVGSIMGSETTAAAEGAAGVTRRDPFAMLPFCGYNMGDYFAHWLDMGKKLGKNAPKIFNVNWFRQDDNGNFLWPGFGENARVLDWILRRCKNEITANESEIGLLPLADDINIDGLSINRETLENLLTIEPELWKKEAVEIEEFYNKFGDKLPKELSQELENLKNKLV
ncbi:MAG: phosphoenolpyruvate carboxykinase (GTP) [Defluviitaleaceae bacterium]|nr:phosphoenolpyruvate carboxykinase (GTP) [Defluviitaleaceae bacterium]